MKARARAEASREPALSEVEGDPAFLGYLA
jgi:hypothetical protein